MTRGKEVLITVSPGETRVALVEDGRLAEIIYDRARADDEDAPGPRGMESHRGAIVLGRVQRVLPGVQAAFVDIGLQRAGFLSARDARRTAADTAGEESGARVPPIGELVREGEALLVQITKDPIGDKGARLSASPTLPGRLVVLVPNSNLSALSRRIENEDDRARLLGVIEALAKEGLARYGLQCGFIARTAALEAKPEELAEDAERLWQQWRDILERRKASDPPALIYRDLGIVASTLRDHVDHETVRVLIDDVAAFTEAKRYAEAVLPDFSERIELHTGPGSPFELYGIEDEIDQLMETRVPLRCGGWITIETTEAMTAIDVNSGSLETGCLEETALRTNVDAAREIGRQLRLRGIGGLIVVDFIHVESPENIEAVMTALTGALTRDRTPVQLTPMSEFGLVEITRKRVREPLGRLLSGPCAACSGHGRVRSAGTVAADVLRRIAAEAAACPGHVLRARVAPEVAAWIGARAQSVLEPLRARVAPGLQIEAARHFSRERFEVDIVRETV